VTGPGPAPGPDVPVTGRAHPDERDIATPGNGASARGTGHAPPGERTAPAPGPGPGPDEDVEVTRSAEQEQFGAALHEMLTSAGTATAARRWAAGDHGPGLQLWAGLARLGVTALAVPESAGGAGASPLDLVVACEELGHHAVPGPVAESLAAVPYLLAGLDGTGLNGTGLNGTGLNGRCAEWLAGLAAGDLLATLARPPRLPYALDADVAGLVLLAGEDEVWLATPGRPEVSVDGTRRLYALQAGVRLAQGPEVAAGVSWAEAAGTLASAAQLLGAGRALLEASVRHARLRVQFGRPVGSFQAVKHRLADVAIALEFARPLLDAAAAALGGRRATAARDISAARVACGDAAYRAARAALQVHGAVGYTAEHDLSLWLAKVTALRSAWGTQADHRATVLASLTTPTGPAPSQPASPPGPVVTYHRSATYHRSVTGEPG
jgi:alkylation response protein AidB-like acyl-CoA dehydrogenase